MHYVCRPARVKIYVNTSKKTMATIHKELEKEYGGKVLLINCGLFDGYFRPCCWLKVDDTVLHTETWHRFGYGIVGNNLVMDTSANISKYHDYFQCVELVRDGKKEDPLSYPAEMGGRRGRTAIGVRADGKVLTFCVKDGIGNLGEFREDRAYYVGSAVWHDGESYRFTKFKNAGPWDADAVTQFDVSMTPEELLDKMYRMGCVSAVMLDGGGSSQCVMPDGEITSSRIVQTLLAIWPVAEPATPPQNTQTTAQTPAPTPVCTDGTKAECKYRPPCGYCAKYYKKCPLVE